MWLVNIFFADFQWILRDFKNIYREEIVHLCVKRFTGRYSCLFSYLKTILESWILKKVIIVVFPQRGCSFFIACATILCGGLDFQDIWVKTSDILPYLYDYGLKKKKLEIKKKIGFFSILPKNFDFFLVFWP